MSLRNRAFKLAPIAALALPLSFALAACGGRLDDKAFQNCPSTENCADTGPIGDDTGGDTDVDTGTDTAPDVYPDGPNGCGFGACTPGYKCQVDSCTTAYCFGDGSWEFSNYCEPDAPPPCPASEPYNGQACYSNGQSCGYYDAGCGTTVYATCYGGTWSVPILDCPPPPPPPPPACPDYEPPAGSGCSVAAAKCSWTSSCGGNDTGYCDPSTYSWSIFPGPCVGTCPSSEPANGSACTGSSSCKWPNSCGGADYGTCSGGRWNIAIGSCPPPPTCPISEPAPGSPCVASGVACGWTNACGGTDRGYCGPGGWSISFGGCPGKCPVSEPPAGSYCNSPGTSCSWPNGCGGSDYGYCNGGRWQMSGGGCPVPVCPSTTPKVGGACSSGLSCMYGNGCGGLDSWYCNAGSWITKGPGYCTPGCPSSKPSTGSACMTYPSSSSCSYVTDPAGQCTSNCFCSDVGSWACTTPTCSGPVPPPYPIDGGVPVYEAGISDAGFAEAW